MPFLTRGKARARQNKPNPPPATQAPVESVSPVISEPEKQIETPTEEESKVSYQEVTYRVPKEERLLDLPLEEDIAGEEYLAPDEKEYNMMPVGDGVSIGVALKKKRRK